MKHEIQMRQRGRKARDAYWYLVLEDDRAELYDEDELVNDWEGGEIVEAVKLPSFWENRKYLGMPLRKGVGIVDFDVVPADLRRIRDFVDRLYVRHNPDAPGKKLLIALGMLIGGGALAGAAIYVSFFIERDGGVQRYWYGGMVMGVIICLSGFFKIFDYPRWSRLAREVGDEPSRGGDRPRRARHDDAKTDDDSRASWRRNRNNDDDES